MRIDINKLPILLNPWNGERILDNFISINDNNVFDGVRFSLNIQNHYLYPMNIVVCTGANHSQVSARYQNKGKTVINEIKDFTSLYDKVKFDGVNYIKVEDDTIIAGKLEIPWPRNLADIKVLSKWGLKQGDSNYIRVLKGSKVIYSNKEDDNVRVDGILGIWDDTRYSASVESLPSVITVADKDYLANKTDLNIVVFDNNYRTVVGHLTLEVNENGNVEILYI